jgi:hypothetical protein
MYKEFVSTLSEIANRQTLSDWPNNYSSPIQTYKKPGASKYFEAANKIPTLATTFLAIALSTSVILKDNAGSTYVTSSQDYLVYNLIPSLKEKKEKLIANLNSYHFYNENWDGYGGIPALNQTVIDVTKFIENLSNNIIIPYSGLSGDGEISLFWKKANIFIDIGFIGDQTYSYFARDSMGNKYYGDEILVNSALPAKLLTVLESI